MILDQRGIIMKYEENDINCSTVNQKIILTNGLMGGVSLRLDLVESVSSLVFSGVAYVVQATAPPYNLNIQSNVTGKVLPLLLSGTPVPLYSGLGIGVSGCLTYENLEFDFQIGNSNEANGRFRYRESISSEWISVTNCKVIVEQESVDKNKAA